MSSRWISPGWSTGPPGSPFITSSRSSPMPESPDSASAPRFTSFAPVYAFGLCDAVHICALVRDAARVLLGHRGRRQPHVAPHRDPELVDGHVLKLRQHPRKRPPDPIGERFVHLAGIRPANVVRLEDGRVHGGSESIRLLESRAPATSF